MVALDETGNKSGAGTGTAEIFDYKVAEASAGKKKYDDLHDSAIGYVEDARTLRLKPGEEAKLNVAVRNGGGETVTMTEFNYNSATDTLTVICNGRSTGNTLATIRHELLRFFDDDMPTDTQGSDGLTYSAEGRREEATYADFLTSNGAHNAEYKTIGEHVYGCSGLLLVIITSSVSYQVLHTKDNKPVTFRVKDSPGFEVDQAGMLRPSGNPRSVQSQRLDFETKPKHQVTVERLLDGTVDNSFFVFVQVTDVEASEELAPPNLANISEPSDPSRPFVKGGNSIGPLTFENHGGEEVDRCEFITTAQASVTQATAAGLEVDPTTDKSTCEVTGTTPAGTVPSRPYTVRAHNVDGHSDAIVKIQITNN